MIERIDIDDIKENPRNPRKISAKNFEKLKDSLKKFPEMQKLRPIIIDEKGFALGGNQRLKALRELGETEAFIIRAENLTAAQKKEFLARDNISLGEWDFAILEEDFEIPELRDFGFSDSEIRSVTGFEKAEGEDEVPEAVPVTQPGDLFEIISPKGMTHRLICGDSTKPETFARLMNGGKCDLVFTDPPYGVSVAKKNALLKLLNAHGESNRSGINVRPIVSDDEKPDALKEILLAAHKNIHDAMADDATYYGTSPQNGGIAMMMMMMMMEAGLEVRHVLIWKKSSATFSMNRLDYDYAHEPIFYTWKKKHNFYGGGQHKDSVWQIAKPSASPEHPTMKPVELIENAILNSSKEGDIVLDAFSGSGSTLIACEKTGRAFRGVEIEPHYADVILARIKKFSPDCVVNKL